jgi:hypothetical protein
MCKLQSALRECSRSQNIQTSGMEYAKTESSVSKERPVNIGAFQTRKEERGGILKRLTLGVMEGTGFTALGRSQVFCYS